MTYQYLVSLNSVNQSIIGNKLHLVKLLFVYADHPCKRVVRMIFGYHYRSNVNFHQISTFVPVDTFSFALFAKNF